MSEQTRRQARLLLVEDNPGDVELFRWALKKAGIDFELDVLGDSGAALEFVRRPAGRAAISQQDLVILDLNLPKAEGSEILRAMRSDAMLASVPVVVLSSSDAPSDRSQAQGPEVRRYMVKPPDVRSALDLGESIRDVLEEISANKP